MNNQKDTQKTDLNSYGQKDFSNTKSLTNKAIYGFANKKTEKLITALYMVTDCMETDDALKEKIRLLGVELLSDIYTLSTLLPMEKNAHIDVSLNRIHQIISFIEIGGTIGYISEMNTNILKNEFNILIEELQSYQIKNKNFTFTLDEKMFEVSREEKDSIYNGQSNKMAIEREGSIKDKRTNNVSFINNKTQKNNVFSKPIRHIDYKKIKEDRSAKIISIIKDKKEATIKDVSFRFNDCSEKTIQRELNDLIEKGQIKKIGEKRWSRYILN